MNTTVEPHLDKNRSRYWVDIAILMLFVIGLKYLLTGWRGDVARPLSLLAGVGLATWLIWRRDIRWRDIAFARLEKSDLLALPIAGVVITIAYFVWRMLALTWIDHLTNHRITQLQATSLRTTCGSLSSGLSSESLTISLPCSFSWPFSFRIRNVRLET